MSTDWINLDFNNKNHLSGNAICYPETLTVFMSNNKYYNNIHTADDNYCSILPCPNGGIFNLKIDKSNRRSSYSGTCSGPGISTYSANTNNVPDIYTRDAKSAIPIKKTLFSSANKPVVSISKHRNFMTGVHAVSHRFN
jgi:hypothetical protein